jgi:hypothetical protein
MTESPEGFGEGRIEPTKRIFPLTGQAKAATKAHEAFGLRYP